MSTEAQFYDSMCEDDTHKIGVSTPYIRPFQARIHQSQYFEPIYQITSFLLEVELRNCNLVDCSIISLCPNLKKISLANNKIIHIYPHQLHHHNLAILDLSSNLISKISDLDHLAFYKSVLYINLYQNPVTKKKAYRDQVLRICPWIIGIDDRIVTDSELLQYVGGYISDRNYVNRKNIISEKLLQCVLCDTEKSLLSVINFQIKCLYNLKQISSPSYRIQKWYRLHKQLKSLKPFVHPITYLQSRVRGFLHRLRVSTAIDNLAALHGLHRYTVHAVETTKMDIVTAKIIIQRFIYGIQSKIKTVNSAVRIQRWYRDCWRYHRGIISWLGNKEEQCLVINQSSYEMLHMYLQKQIQLNRDNTNGTSTSNIPQYYWHVMSSARLSVYSKISCITLKYQDGKVPPKYNSTPYCSIKMKQTKMKKKSNANTTTNADSNNSKNITSNHSRKVYIKRDRYLFVRERLTDGLFASYSAVTGESQPVLVSQQSVTWGRSIASKYITKQHYMTNISMIQRKRIALLCRRGLFKNIVMRKHKSRLVVPNGSSFMTISVVELNNAQPFNKRSCMWCIRSNDNPQELWRIYRIFRMLSLRYYREHDEGTDFSSHRQRGKKMPIFWERDVVHCSSSIEIQRMWRGVRCRMNMSCSLVNNVIKRRAIIAIQRWWRMKTGLLRRFALLSKINSTCRNITSSVVYMDSWIYFNMLRMSFEPSSSPSLMQYPEYNGYPLPGKNSECIAFQPLVKSAVATELDSNQFTLRTSICPSRPSSAPTGRAPRGTMSKSILVQFPSLISPAHSYRRSIPQWAMWRPAKELSPICASASVPSKHDIIYTLIASNCRVSVIPVPLYQHKTSSRPFHENTDFFIIEIAFPSIQEARARCAMLMLQTYDAKHDSYVDFMSWDEIASSVAREHEKIIMWRNKNIKSYSTAPTVSNTDNYFVGNCRPVSATIPLASIYDNNTFTPVEIPIQLSAQSIKWFERTKKHMHVDIGDIIKFSFMMESLSILNRSKEILTDTHTVSANANLDTKNTLYHDGYNEGSEDLYLPSELDRHTFGTLLTNRLEPALTARVMHSEEHVNQKLFHHAIRVEKGIQSKWKLLWEPERVLRWCADMGMSEEKVESNVNHAIGLSKSEEAAAMKMRAIYELRCEQGVKLNKHLVDEERRLSRPNTSKSSRPSSALASRPTTGRQEFFRSMKDSVRLAQNDSKQRLHDMEMKDKEHLYTNMLKHDASREKTLLTKRIYEEVQRQKKETMVRKRLQDVLDHNAALELTKTRNDALVANAVDKVQHMRKNKNMKSKIANDGKQGSSLLTAIGRFSNDRCMAQQKENKMQDLRQRVMTARNQTLRMNVMPNDVDDDYVNCSDESAHVNYCGRVLNSYVREKNTQRGDVSPLLHKNDSFGSSYHEVLIPTTHPITDTNDILEFNDSVNLTSLH